MNWDLSNYFSEFNGPEMLAFKASLERDIRGLLQKSSCLESLTNESLSEWEDVFIKAEEALMRLSHLASYVSCLISTDAYHEDYAREEGTLHILLAEQRKLDKELARAFFGIKPEIFD